MWPLRAGNKSTSDRALSHKRMYVITTDNDIPIICYSDQMECRCLLGFRRQLWIPDDVTESEGESIRVKRTAC